MHGSLSSIKFTWQQNYSRQKLREITKSLKSAISGTPLCKLAQDTTHILKMHGWHLWKEDKMLNNSPKGAQAYHARINYSKNDKSA